MNELFTIISIVIAVSGSTYTALITLRSYLGSNLLEKVKTSEEFMTSLSESSNTSLCKGSEKKYGRLCWWRKFWRGSLAIPIILFTLASFTIAIHALVAYWHSPVDPPDNGWKIYRWLILGLIFVDFVCILVTFVSYWSMNGLCDDIESNYQVEQDQQSQSVKRQED